MEGGRQAVRARTPLTGKLEPPKPADPTFHLTQVMEPRARPPQACVVTSRPIPIRLCEAPHATSVEIDGARVARGLGLEVSAFRQLMADHKIGLLCERGTGEDAGLWRATFYFGDRRLRLLVDAQGNVLAKV